MSSTARSPFPAFRTRKQVKAEQRTAYWVRKLKDAETSQDALKQAWDWFLGALRDLDDRRPEAADAARYHMARSLAVFTVKLPEAKIELRSGLNEDEEAALADPWSRRTEAAR